MKSRLFLPGLLVLFVFCRVNVLAQNGGGSKDHPAPLWHFAVSGDSRNCGDVVMPGIAAGVLRDKADFYWHLGDFRVIYDFDQDFKQLATSGGKPLRIIDYYDIAWDEFIQNQIVPFGSLPIFLGIGNHETIYPKTRNDYIIQFADWLDRPELQLQRLKDNPRDHRLKTYYHWQRDGVDFINLDNATHDQFDDEQVRWFEAVLARAAADPDIKTIVVGMHAALPDSISFGHSMNEWAGGEQSGRRVYQDLLQAQNQNHKTVYVLASHSHYYMDGIFNTEKLRPIGVLPGWIIGTGGAIRAPLPANAGDAHSAKTMVYGYLLATVKADKSIAFEFRQINETDLPPDVPARFGADFVHGCFAGNAR